jgi:hypothetical protein
VLETAVAMSATARVARKEYLFMIVTY